MDSKIIDFQTRLDNELNNLRNVAAPYLKTNPEAGKVLDDIQHIYDTKVKNIKPKIMVFGLYNAGKSSIINELMRQDIAKVADIPTTDRVDEYPWHGYSIADTPGVGAPIEHEKVTNEAIRQADVVLFVMSTTGSSEKKDNYVRMKDIAEAGKKIIIVLNDKNDDIINHPEAIAAISRKVHENMQNTGIVDVNNKFTVVCVNASLAHKGRIKNKSMLWEKSRMSELESTILAELKETSDFDVLRNSVYEISRDVEKLENLLKSGQGSKASETLQPILDGLRKSKKQLRNDMYAYIDSQTERLAQALPDAIWAVKDSEEKVNETVQNEIRTLEERVERKFGDQTKIVMEDTANDLEQFAYKVQKTADAEKYKTTVGMEPFAGAAAENAGTFTKGPDDIIEKLGGSMLKGEMTAKAYEEMAAMAGNLSKQILKDMGIKVGRKGVGDYALKKLGLDVILKKLPIPVPGVGEIFMVWSLLKGLLGDDGSYQKEREKAERENAIAQQKAEMERQYRQQLSLKCKYMAENINDDLKHWSNQAVDQTLGKLDRDIQDQMKKFRGDEKSMRDAVYQISRIFDACQELAVELGYAEK